MSSGPVQINPVRAPIILTVGDPPIDSLAIGRLKGDIVLLSLHGLPSL